MDDIDKDDNVSDKVEKFVQEFHVHGIGCGRNIAEIVKEIHPFAVAIIPLYRSCIVLEQSEEQKKDGTATIHAYADPHWLGGEIDVHHLKSDDFHKTYIVQGDRQGPIFVEQTNKNKSLDVD